MSWLGIRPFHRCARVASVKASRGQICSCVDRQRQSLARGVINDGSMATYDLAMKSRPTGHARQRRTIGRCPPC